MLPKVSNSRAREEADMFGKQGARGINLGFGFNLIGLLLVVVILGISAALAVSALGGTKAGKRSGTTAETTVGATAGTTAGNIGAIAKQSAVVACESDATEVETALQEYSAVHGVASTVVTPALLTSGPSPDLVSFPSSPDYTISIVSGVVMIAAPKTSAPVAYGTSGACAKAGS
jgi:type II secretory pathway pseudopilin PulG